MRFNNTVHITLKAGPLNIPPLPLFPPREFHRFLPSFEYYRDTREMVHIYIFFSSQAEFLTGSNLGHVLWQEVQLHLLHFQLGMRAPFVLWKWPGGCVIVPSVYALNNFQACPSQDGQRGSANEGCSLAKSASSPQNGAVLICCKGKVSYVRASWQLTEGGEKKVEKKNTLKHNVLGHYELPGQLQCALTQTSLQLSQGVLGMNEHYLVQASSKIFRIFIIMTATNAEIRRRCAFLDTKISN